LLPACFNLGHATASVGNITIFREAWDSAKKTGVPGAGVSSICGDLPHVSFIIDSFSPAAAKRSRRDVERAGI
jgi:hypothetical protein